MSKRRRPDGDPNDIDEFDDQFDEMREYMTRLVEQLASSDASHEEVGPFVYGFSMRMGPDGKPVMHRFGDTRALPQERDGESESMRPGVRQRRSDSKRDDERFEDGTGEREPLTDVIEDAKNVCITVEIPGVEKKDIELSVVGQVLKIKVDSAERRYFKEVHLPAHVDPDSTKATYNNGVLDISLSKSNHGSEKRIKIE